MLSLSPDGIDVCIPIEGMTDWWIEIFYEYLLQTLDSGEPRGDIFVAGDVGQYTVRETECALESGGGKCRLIIPSPSLFLLTPLKDAEEPVQIKVGDDLRSILFTKAAVVALLT